MQNEKGAEATYVNSYTQTHPYICLHKQKMSRRKQRKLLTTAYLWEIKLQGSGTFTFHFPFKYSTT